MKVKALFVFAIVFVLALVPIAIQAQEAPHWTYEGEEGPEHWGELAPEFAMCSEGRTQSPIDIATTVSADLNNIEFSYGDSVLNMLNNGHTIQANYDEGSSITYNGVEYDLLQFHFHHPSEHTINGVASPLEVHFVHRSEAGNLAVVGVMLMEGEEANAAYAGVFDHLLAEEGTETFADVTLSAATMLPEAKTYYTYSGSLTTPPCSEGVRWLLLTDPVWLSHEQIEAFSAIFELDARPVQPQNARDVIVDSTN